MLMARLFLHELQVEPGFDQVRGIGTPERNVTRGSFSSIWRFPRLKPMARFAC
jgi:hypothetical protein